MQDGFNRMKRRILFCPKRNAERIFFTTVYGIKKKLFVLCSLFYCYYLCIEMKFTGELISLGVAFLWTLASIACEVAGKQFGAVILNVWRMLLTFFALILFLWWAMDNPFPIYASTNTIIWLMLSGVIGYFFGDWCLLKGYLIIGARYGQLIMTLAPLFAAFFAFTFLHQTLTWQILWQYSSLFRE